MKAHIARYSRFVFGLVLIPLLINLVFLPKFPLWNLFAPSYYKLTSSDRAGLAAVKLIPKNASVTAQDAIAAHLSQRNDIFELKPGAPNSEYVIASEALTTWPNPEFITIKTYLAQQETVGYKRVFEKEGWVVLRRP
jgi:hypothetical protein